MQFLTGISALRAQQTALAVAGHNIANAATPGYHRQEVRFAENPSIDLGGHLIGTGVSVETIHRATNDAAEEALHRTLSDGASVATRLSTARQIESLFLPGSGNLLERVETLFNDLQSLSSRSDDATLRRAALNSAEKLAQEIQRVSSTLDKIAANLEREAASTLEEVHSYGREIAGLNRQIAALQAAGQEPHDLLDKRSVLVQELAKLIDVESRTTRDGRQEYVLGGVFLLDQDPVEITLQRNDLGQLEVWKPGCDQPIMLHGGKLAGLLSSHTEGGGVGEVRGRLDEFTRALMAGLDAAHAFGVGLSGGFAALQGTRAVDDAAVPLADAGSVLPISAGRLFVSVTDGQSGDVTLHGVDIDPTSDSLADVAQALNGIDHVNAVVDAVGGRLVINAEAGFTFDFTGSLSSQPDAAAITGTTQPRISGRFAGSSNDAWTFTFQGSGMVGVDADVRLEVRDSAGSVVRVLDVGQDYAPGTELVVGEGVSVALSSGVANLGDSFQVELAGRPDETGLLAALGLNTLFRGGGAADISVDPRLLEDPFRFATTVTGDPSDTTNLLRMSQLRDQRLAAGNLSLEQYLTDMTTAVGREVRELTQVQQNTDAVREMLEAEIAELSGVDVNEELARMLEFQRGFQAAARYISVLDESLQELFGIIG